MLSFLTTSTSLTLVFSTVFCFSFSLDSLYSKEEISLLEGLIEPFSPAGKHMRKEYDFKTNYWSAIPGGIPSFLINGVCIKNNDFSSETIEEIGNLFPNATVFKGDLEVVRYPQSQVSQSDKKNL